jgi:hypothetical protein
MEAKNYKYAMQSNYARVGRGFDCKKCPVNANLQWENA